YVLIGSDDFDFKKDKVREGVQKMVDVLDGDPDMAVAAGRVNGMAYEVCLERNGSTGREAKRKYRGKAIRKNRYTVVDLTVNFCLVRRSILGMDKIHWDGGDVKIGGGEHGA